MYPIQTVTHYFCKSLYYLYFNHVHLFRLSSKTGYCDIFEVVSASCDCIFRPSRKPNPLSFFQEVGGVEFYFSSLIEMLGNLQEWKANVRSTSCNSQSGSMSILADLHQKGPTSWHWLNTDQPNPADTAVLCTAHLHSDPTSSKKKKEKVRNQSLNTLFLQQEDRKGTQIFWAM